MRALVWMLTALLAGALALGLSRTQGTLRPRLESSRDWAGRGVWIPADTHVHTKFSDGAYTVDEVISKAVEHGCRAVAVTDHADRRLGGASDEYMAAIRSARTARPDLVILAGLEWNVPPRHGDDHVSVLVPDDPAEAATLREFKARFDDYDRTDGITPNVDDALAWLVSAAEIGRRGDPKPVAIYNHPSRKDVSSLENVDDVLRWRSVNDLVIGFETGPGHQNKPPLGSYDGTEGLIDRWDPVAARPGDAWDTLLGKGVRVHGAIASSDFHDANPRSLNDFWPCQFAETWYYAPERTTAGILRAMRAGAFFGAHGHIAREVELTLAAEGLPRPAAAGEQIVAASGTPLTLSLTFRVPETDWQGAPNHVDQVEVFVITAGNVDVRSHAITGTGVHKVSETLVLGHDPVAVRARGRRVVQDGPDLMFYTNAILVSVR